MKEAIRMVPESIYDPEFPDTSHCSSGRGSHSALRRIKEEWGTSRWFLEFDIRKCFHTIDRHRFISFFKEEIDDPKFFYPTHLLFSAGQLVGGEKGPYSVPHSVLLSALPGNIYLHKLDQEIGRIRQKHEIPLVLRIRSVLLRTGKSLSDQEKEKYGEEASFNAPQDNRAIIVGRIKSTRRYTRPFHSLVSSWHTPPTSTPRRRGDQKTPFVFPPALAAFLNKPSSLLCAAFLIEAAGLTPKAEFYGREGFNKNLAMRNLIKYCKRRGLLIELGGEAILVLRSERGLARKLTPLKTHDLLIRICYARYADDLLLGIVGAVELLIEIQKRITHFLQSGLWVGSAGSTTIAARSTVEFPGTVIREVPPRTTPIQFLRELEKRLRVKHRIHITACHLRSAIHSKQATVQVNTFMPKTIAVWFHGHGKSSLSNAMNDLKAMKRQIHGSSSFLLPEVHVKSEWPICLKRGLNVMPFVYEAKGRRGPKYNEAATDRSIVDPIELERMREGRSTTRIEAATDRSIVDPIELERMREGRSTTRIEAATDRSIVDPIELERILCERGEELSRKAKDTHWIGETIVDWRSTTEWRIEAATDREIVEPIELERMREGRHKEPATDRSIVDLGYARLIRRGPTTKVYGSDRKVDCRRKDRLDCKGEGRRAVSKGRADVKEAATVRSIVETDRARLRRVCNRSTVRGRSFVVLNSHSRKLAPSRECIHELKILLMGVNGFGKYHELLLLREGRVIVIVIFEKILLGDSFRLHYMPFTAKEAMPLSRPPRAFALSIFSLGSRIPIKELTKGMSGRGYRQIARPLGYRKIARPIGRERGATYCDKVFDAVQLAPTLGTAGVRSAQVSEVSQVVPVKHIRQGSREISLLHSPRSGRSNVPSDVQQAVSRSGMSVRKFSLYTPAGRKAKGEGGGRGSFSSEFPIQINAPIKKILRRLRDRGLISRFRPRPIHVASLTNVSDGDIVNRSAGIAISLLSYYRCCDNLYQVRTIVDHQIRWSAIFTPAHKHKSSARNIIPKYPKDSNIVNQEGGKTLAEFPNSIELGKLGPGFEENNDGALNIMFNK